MPGAQWKFVVLINRKLGSAPLRNRQKRWVREAFRKARAHLSIPGSVLIRIQQPAHDFAQVQEAFLEAYQMAIQSRDRVG